MASMTMRTASLRASPFGVSRSVSRANTVRVQAAGSVTKKTKVILVKDLQNVGKEGDIRSVPMGYWRNFLLPQGIAKIADAKILEAIRQQKEDQIRAAMEVKAQAQALATALATLGKFIVKKKVGEKDSIYGSVSKSDICDAIYQQTGQRLEDKDFVLPDMKTVGTYECSVRLHPEVSASFSVVIQKDKALDIKVTEDGSGKSAGKKKK